MNHIATDIIEISHSKLLYYTGEPGEVCDVYKRRSVSRGKELAREAQAAAPAGKASNATKGHSARHQPEEDVLAGPSGVYKVCFPFPQPPPLPLPIISVEDISFGWDPSSKPLLFSGLSTAVTLDSRIALVGKGLALSMQNV